MQDLERFLDRRTHVDEALASARTGFGDVENFLFGGFEQFLARTPFRSERITGDFGASINQLPQHGFLAHDISIGHDVRRTRRRIRQLDHVARAADQFREVLSLEPVAERHRIVGHALVRQVLDRAKDQAMILAVEVPFVEPISNAIPRFRSQHQAAEYGLLGLDRMRRHAQCLDVGGRFAFVGK